MFTKTIINRDPVDGRIVSLSLLFVKRKLQWGPTPNFDHFDWHEDHPQYVNYNNMGVVLAYTRRLYRQSDPSDGLLYVRPDGTTKRIVEGADLAPIITEHVKTIRVYLERQLERSWLTNSQLTAMLASEAFLSQLKVLDVVTPVPAYIATFSLTLPGYNLLGKGNNYYYTGDHTIISGAKKWTKKFLDGMYFASPADRANALAAKLTVMLRNHWPGCKPIILVTSGRDHTGKNIVLDFAAGATKKRSVSYDSADWVLERSMVETPKYEDAIGLLVIENVRVNGDNSNASAYTERLKTDPESVLFSGTGLPQMKRNDLVIGISTDAGTVGEDIHNRSVSIHLSPPGRVAGKESVLANRWRKFLIKHRDDLDAELHGMIHRWRNAGMPRDEAAKHACSDWAAEIGGILMVNGIEGFLGSTEERRVSDGPTR